MNKKYLPSALILYLNYFIHGVGCSILGTKRPASTMSAGSLYRALLFKYLDRRYYYDRKRNQIKGC